MNTHEIERIADAMNRLRPDWPVKQLQTLLASPGLSDRPRRDVTVALAWVACESGTANPYRVLESGPWWRAAAVEGATTAGPDKTTPHIRCGVCGKRRDRCENTPRYGDDDHRFEPDFKEKRGPEVVQIVDAVKAEIQPTATTPVDDAATPGAGRARAEAALTTATHGDLTNPTTEPEEAS